MTNQHPFRHLRSLQSFATLLLLAYAGPSISIYGQQVLPLVASPAGKPKEESKICAECAKKFKSIADSREKSAKKAVASAKTAAAAEGSAGVSAKAAAVSATSAAASATSADTSARNAEDSATEAKAHLDSIPTKLGEAVKERAQKILGSFASNGTENGIGFGEPKLFDNRTLALMLDSLSENLRTIQVVDQKSIMANLGLFQGSRVDEFSPGGSGARHRQGRLFDAQHFCEGPATLEDVKARGDA